MPVGQQHIGHNAAVTILALVEAAKSLKSVAGKN